MLIQYGVEDVVMDGLMRTTCDLAAESVLATIELYAVSVLFVKI
jgi:hypothetical protein